MAGILPQGKQNYISAAGIPLVGGKLYTYDAGTTTPRTTYADSAATTPNTNPVVLDSRGEATIFWSGSYKVELRDALDNLIWTVDNVFGSDVALGALTSQLGSLVNASYGPALIGLNATLAYAENTLGRHVTEWVSPHDYPWLAPTDGVSDCTAALAGCLAFAAANGRGVRLNAGRTYTISSISLPANTHLMTMGAKFRADGTVTGNSNIIAVAENCVIDQIYVTTPAPGADRPVQFNGADSVCGKIRVIADAQAGGIENLDGAVQIRADRVSIGSIYVQNYEVGVVLFGNGTAITDISIDTIQIKSYVRGVYVRNVQRVHIGFLMTDTASANASTTPGHNGILFSGGYYMTLGGYLIQDSGEHGIRIGGSNGVELRTKHVRIGDGMVIRPGQCGFKANPGTNLAGDRHKYITVGNITVVDCAATSATGSNEDAFRAENTDYITVGKVSAFKEAKANSCNVGLFFAQCADVSVNDYYVDTPLLYGVEVSETSEGSSGAVGAHSIKGGYIKSSAGSSIAVNCATVSVSRIVIEGFTSITPVSDAVETNISSATGCLFRGVSYAPGSGKHYDGTISNGIMLDILAEGFYAWRGPADSANAQNAAPGVVAIRDSGLDPTAAIGDIRGTIALVSTSPAATGVYTPGIVGLQGQSVRRRWAIAGYAGGGDSDQYGIRFFVYTSTATGSDALTLAGEWDFNGYLLPGADNTRTLGSSSFRWSVVYAGTGAINTSDEREKEQIEGIPDAWLDAWAAVEYVRYKFKDAVVAKGDGARWHVGLIAQRVAEAFVSRGLDPFAVGIVCYDKWDDFYTDVLDEEGNPTGEKKLERPGGDRYGIRYEEALCLEAALLRRELAKVKVQ